MNKIIITTIIFLAGFVSFWFTADYADWCLDWNITSGGVNYNCKFCNWDMYRFAQKRGGIDFYNRCCEWKTEGGTGSDAICCSYGTAFTWWACVSCEIIETVPSNWQANCDAWSAWCNQANLYTWSNWVQLCCPGMMVNGDDWNPVCIENNELNMWINMDSECLLNWQCSYNIYQTLWIRKSDQDPSVSSFVKDIVLAVTMFIGTVVSIILIVSGIMYVMAGLSWNWELATKAKKWLFNSILWLLLVVSSYAIVRLIQFLATAGWW